MSDLKNIIIAVSLTIAIILGWQFFYETPRMKLREQARQSQAVKKESAAKQKETQIGKSTNARSTFFADRDEAIKKSRASRIKISSPKLGGSISLVGARLDDLVLLKYKTTLDKDSDPVALFSPSKYKDAYFAEFGWTSDDQLELPTVNTLWKANKETLKANDNVVLSWESPRGLVFKIDISLDKDYMFTVTQTIKNQSSRTVDIKNYALINRIFVLDDKQSKISHEGGVGVFNNILKEVSYKDMETEKLVALDNNPSGSWFGFSDKYWLTAIIPQMGGKKFNARFQCAHNVGRNKFQIDYISENQTLEPGEVSKSSTNLFAGAKVLSLLDAYEQKYKISLFDRAIDFGWFYFITKPMFNALKYFYDLFGNFGVSILIVTIIVKLLLFPLGNKSYKSMNKMKTLQPEMTRIKALHADDKMKQNQAVMELYKKEKVSPLSGCLPMLIQIPIFFSLYKVLFISIEMRQAPFFGWIKDLSVPDPTSAFNLFGLLPISPPTFLMIGAWPIIMAITMFLQQSLSPEPADPMQAKVMKFLPLFFLFMFSSFPAGLVIYWAWSNTLSIAQQYGIKYLHKESKKA